MSEIYRVNHIDFKVNIIYKRKNRSIYLRVKNNEIYITTPHKLLSTNIVNMIQTNFNSIVKLMNESRKVEDQIHFLGDCYELVITQSTINLVYIKEKQFIVETKDKALVTELINVFYKNSLMKIVEIYGKDIQNKFNVSGNVKFSYKAVKGYYGECFPKRKEIILNVRLAKYEIKYIVSVLYHEFAHFKYQNHQQEFYDYLEGVYPNYREVQKNLRDLKYNEVY